MASPASSELRLPFRESMAITAFMSSAPFPAAVRPRPCFYWDSLQEKDDKSKALSGSGSTKKQKLVHPGGTRGGRGETETQREGRGPMGEDTRKRIVFRGAVQGVGLRYRAQHAADLYGCTGWVRNEWDGSVCMEIQGDEASIDRVLLAIERGSFVRIEAMDCRTVPLEPEERGFHTR